MFGGLAASNLTSCNNKKMSFKISLAEWSLHRRLRSGSLDHLDFASVAKNDFNIGAIEYVNTFFFNRATDKDYLSEQEAHNWLEEKGAKYFGLPYSKIPYQLFSNKEFLTKLSEVAYPNFIKLIPKSLPINWFTCSISSSVSKK